LIKKIKRNHNNRKIQNKLLKIKINNKQNKKTTNKIKNHNNKQPQATI